MYNSTLNTSHLVAAVYESRYKKLNGGRMSKTRARKNDDVESTETNQKTEATGGNQEKLLDIMQKLLVSQTAIVEDQKKSQDRMLTRALEQEEAEKERWREQLEWRKAEKEHEQQRATQEWNLRMEELRLRNEELKRSEEKSIETQARLERKEEQQRLQRRAEKMEPWRDCDQAAIPGDELPNRLVPLLTGKVLAAYHAQVTPTAAKSYDELKEALLDALGLSVDHCRRKFWSFHWKYSDSPQEVLRQIETTFHRLTHMCKSWSGRWCWAGSCPLIRQM